MTPDDVLDEFKSAGALREGHFVLSSGLHSPMFLQKNLVFQDARRAERLCTALAVLIGEKVGEIDVVVSPAVGAIIPGYETGRQLGKPSIFVEREGGAFKFRRGFHLERSGGRADVGVPLVALATLDVPAYPADALPAELAALPVEDPGSRRLKG
jgi:orotate phosphoribosyltransferase